MRRLLLFLMLLAGPAAAALSPIGGALLDVFDPGVKAFRPQLAVVAYQPPAGGTDPGQAEVLQLHLPGFKAGSPLNARLQLDRLPHYQAWMERRRQEGGLAWKALAALLQEVQDRPVVFLTLGPLPGQGPAEIRVGLLEGKRFDLYAQVRGTVASSQRGLVFEIRDFSLEKASAQAAWPLLAPLARSQAGRMAQLAQGAQ